ncbi:MAG TPA: AtpZ/AtpI family protein [Actinomycetota bacterium]|nr:AtpZ/AtpI family protein [Actinomycetota bacterium]
MSRPTGGSGRDDAWSGVGVGWAIVSTLVAGMLVLGGLGYVLDRVLGTDAVLTAIGIVLGGALGIYGVYLRHGRGGE